MRTDAAKPDTVPTLDVRVTVAGRFQVHHDGVIARPGDELTVADNELTARWVALGWVTRG